MVNVLIKDDIWELFQIDWKDRCQAFNDAIFRIIIKYEIPKYVRLNPPYGWLQYKIFIILDHIML